MSIAKDVFSRVIFAVHIRSAHTDTDTSNDIDIDGGHRNRNISYGSRSNYFVKFTR